MRTVTMTAMTLALALLAGCGTTVPLAELERHALLTGDWSAVEAREQQIARRAARRGPKCPGGQVGYCESSFGHERCACVDSSVLADVFAWR